MGIYFNDEDHPYIFKNEEDMDVPNQSIAQYDYWSDLVHEQKRAQSKMNQSLKGLTDQVERNEFEQKERWRKLAYKWNEQRKYNEKHRVFEHHVKDVLEEMESKQERLQEKLNEENEFKQAILEQLHHLKQSNMEIENRLKSQEAANDHLLSALQELRGMQNEMAGQNARHEERHKEVIGRLESQEALTEKVLRQVVNLRSILFERAGHLAEKIENGYQLTSSYIYKLMTGSVQPLQLFLLEQKEKQKKGTD